MLTATIVAFLLSGALLPLGYLYLLYYWPMDWFTLRLQQ